MQVILIGFNGTFCQKTFFCLIPSSLNSDALRLQEGSSTIPKQQFLPMGTKISNTNTAVLFLECGCQAKAIRCCDLFPNLWHNEVWWHQQENAHKPAPKPHQNINKTYIFTGNANVIPCIYSSILITSTMKTHLVLSQLHCTTLSFPICYTSVHLWYWYPVVIAFFTHINKHFFCDRLGKSQHNHGGN